MLGRSENLAETPCVVHDSQVRRSRLLPGQPYGERLTALNTWVVRFNVQVDFGATRLQ